MGSGWIRGREWLIAIIAGGIIGAVAQGAAMNRKADRLEATADSLRDAYNAERDRRVAVTDSLSALSDSLTQRLQATLDSLTDLPEPVPTLPPRIITVLDTAQLNAEVRFAVDELRRENSQLRTQNDTLRLRLQTIEQVTAQAIADLRRQQVEERTVWQTRIDEAEATIAAQSAALEARRANISWRKWGWWKDKLIWGAIGYGVGELIERAVAHDNGGSTVIVNHDSCPPVCEGYGGARIVTSMTFPAGR